MPSWVGDILLLSQKQVCRLSACMYPLFRAELLFAGLFGSWGPAPCQTSSAQQPPSCMCVYDPRQFPLKQKAGTRAP
eukprot:1142049-Pelagomonas_calceolata.AAC.7